jgi:hypothetical protein
MHYFQLGLWSKVVHCIGNRAPFGIHPRFVTVNVWSALSALESKREPPTETFAITIEIY